MKNPSFFWLALVLAISLILGSCTKQSNGAFISKEKEVTVTLTVTDRTETSAMILAVLNYKPVDPKPVLAWHIDKAGNRIDFPETSTASADVSNRLYFPLSSLTSGSDYTVWIQVTGYDPVAVTVQTLRSLFAQSFPTGQTTSVIDVDILPNGERFGITKYRLIHQSLDGANKFLVPTGNIENEHVVAVPSGVYISGTVQNGYSEIHRYQNGQLDPVNLLDAVSELSNGAIVTQMGKDADGIVWFQTNSGDPLDKTYKTFQIGTVGQISKFSECSDYYCEKEYSLLQQANVFWKGSLGNYLGGSVTQFLSGIDDYFAVAKGKDCDWLLGKGYSNQVFLVRVPVSSNGTVGSAEVVLVSHNGMPSYSASDPVYGLVTIGEEVLFWQRGKMFSYNTETKVLLAKEMEISGITSPLTLGHDGSYALAGKGSDIVKMSLK